MPLDPTNLLALAAACAPAVAPSTLLAVVRTESGLDPFAIGLNGPGGGRMRLGTRAEAVRRAQGLIAAGRNVDLGLGQINVRNLAALGLSVADAFDPCRNLAASAKVLEAGYRRAAPSAGQEQRALRTALSFYNTGDPERGFRNGYVTRVAAMAAASRPTFAARSRSAEPSPRPSWQVFGPVRPTASHFVITPIAGALP